MKVRIKLIFEYCYSFHCLCELIKISDVEQRAFFVANISQIHHTLEGITQAVHGTTLHWHQKEKIDHFHFLATM